MSSFPHLAQQLPTRAFMLVVAAAAASAGCAIPLARGPDAPELDQKRIAAKHEPDRLEAVDGTWCLVPRGKFDRAREGGHAWCVWSRAAGERREGVATGPGPHAR